MSRDDGVRSPRRVWIDIDNPPQVQYLAPFVDAFARRGAEVLVTARDHGIAYDLLRQRGVEFVPVGAHPGPSKVAKTTAVLRRAGSLVRRLRRWKPDAAVFATRSAALAAPVLGTPAFAFVDYEFVDLRAFRAARSNVVHPAMISGALRGRGLSPSRLVPYDGIKEDITCLGIDLDEVRQFSVPELRGSALRVVVRPPDHKGHYYREMSGMLTHLLLEHLSKQDDVVVILSPRYPEQESIVDAFAWKEPPVVLREAVPFMQLLSAADAVVTGGGTMAREAAYLGVPSFSVFGGELGVVDRFLEKHGRLVVVRDRDAIAALRFERHPRAPVLASNPSAIEDIVDAVSRTVARVSS